MVDFSRLSVNWHRWGPAIGGGNIGVTTECEDCTIRFTSTDYSVHVREEQTWWVVDTVNDRGQRRNAAAKLSNFELAEKYLIWDWATTARSDLASGRLGADLAKQGFAPKIEVSKIDTKYKICSGNDCAILSEVNATIFSHLIDKSVDQIERLITGEPS
ncbi:hypothetical protein PICSAR240_03871 [Mycobacterium avium subsp. paratuberculosis]|nr:hypothetical protein [Mycobacterium avium]OUZ01306.1 hypothetical protein B0172_04586 [Mycobacterium avium subsp. paratuberculosis]OVF02681.1 hypothetical protein B0173_03134 [Mycobacterium avium subsp. paratuberculosis]QKU47298.1 hypothetical protein MAP44135_3995 [Mycobacterium avium subsp. paratuberculosis]UKO59154.1 hypothetical protein KYH25_19615 [Mycobacterium avium subsp. paratuberculosis]UKO63468.1 hypothetical protein KYF43_19630 [Mycobacterium avium subsp. paratuberculosis]